MEETMDDAGIKALESFFAQAALPDQVQLDPGTRIINVGLFVKTQFTILKESTDQVARRLAFERLLRLKAVL